MSKQPVTLISYEQASAYLGEAQRRDMLWATFQVARLPEQQAIALFYKNMPVVKWYKNGNIQLFSNGWRTIYLRQRLASFLPAGYTITAPQGQWALNTPLGTIPFREGISLDERPGEVKEEIDRRPIPRRGVFNRPYGLYSDDILLCEHHSLKMKLRPYCEADYKAGLGKMGCPFCRGGALQGEFSHLRNRTVLCAALDKLAEVSHG